MTVKENWPDIIRTDMYKYFSAEYREIEKMNSYLYNIVTSDIASERLSSAGEFPDLESFDGIVSYGDMYEGYLKTLTHSEYAGGLQIRSTLIEDAKGAGNSMIFNERPRALARATSRTREKHGIVTFNDAFTAEPTDSDGAELCASDHARPKDSTTQSNEGTTSFSATAVEATRLLIGRFKDDQGDFCDANMNTLYVPFDLEEDAWEVINTKGKVDTANNNENFHKGRYKLAVCKRFSSTTNWFGVDSTMNNNSLYWFNRTPIRFFKDESSDTMSAKYISYFRRSLGWRNWRFIYGHDV